MKSPIIKDCYFDPGMDRPINTKTLRAIYEIMGVKYDNYHDSFTAKNWESWTIAIEDQHDREDEPHYRLEVGEGDIDRSTRWSFSFRYCNYHSDETGKIITDPGRWFIRVWLPQGSSDREAASIAKQISFAYEQAMIESLPDYEIISENENFR